MTILTTEILGRENRIILGDKDPTSPAMGRSNSSVDELWIWKGMPMQARASTLIHEWIHQVSDYLGLGLTEQQTQGLEVALHQAGFKIQIQTHEIPDETTGTNL